MNTIREAVAKLIADGWAVVPIAPGEKGPRANGWQTTVFGPDDFSDDHNVGVKVGKPSGGRCDVDLDAPEAVSTARTLLARTGLVSGRPGKPSSHHWFTCPKAELRKYKDVDQTMLLEVRASTEKSVHQTVVPPSTHPSGESIQWETERGATKIEWEALERSVALTAIAALLARHWPTGSRHQIAGDLAGWLHRQDLDSLEVESVIRAAASAAKDNEVEDRARYARETCEKLEKGQHLKVTGGKALLDSLGEHASKILARILAWLGREGEDQIDEVNARHFVTRVGGDVVVAFETGNPREGLALMSATAFRTMYMNRRIGKETLGDAWLESPRRRTFSRVDFAPPPLSAPPDVYNLWAGFDVTADPEPHPERRCARFLAHAHDVICGGSDAHAEYLFDLMASAVQSPGQPAEVAVVMMGKRGTGKGLLMRYLGRLFGRHYLQVEKQDHIVGKFNAHMSGKVLVFADEAVWAGDKRDASTLKRLITEDTIQIERKGVDVVTEPNVVHLYMATNEDWAVPVGFSERRFFVLDVSSARMQDHEYFAPLVEEMRGAGPAALLAWLQQRVVTRNLRVVPKTTALTDQQDRSMASEAAWWLEKLKVGHFTGGTSWPRWKSTEAAHLDYKEWCADMRVSRPVTLDAFGRKLKDWLPAGTKMKRMRVVPIAPRGIEVEGDKVLRRGFALPILGLCRRSFDEYTGLMREWEDPDSGETGTEPFDLESRDSE